MELLRVSSLAISADAGLQSAWLTPHAAVRRQQRGVDPGALACLLAYGRRQHDHHGCEVISFDEASLAAVARQEPPPVWKKAEASRSLYAVVDSDGVVVTTGHRFRRVLRDTSISSYRPGRTRRPRVLHASTNRYCFS